MAVGDIPCCRHREQEAVEVSVLGFLDADPSGWSEMRPNWKNLRYLYLI